MILGSGELLEKANPAEKSFVKDLKFDKINLDELPIELITWESIDTNLLYFTDVLIEYYRYHSIGRGFFYWPMVLTRKSENGRLQILDL